jgi:endoglucanase
VPGLLIFGPTDGRSNAHYQRAVTDKLYPTWEALPRQRRWGDGWSAIAQNEPASRNMGYQVLLHTFLASVL